jgi:hypothetical protein
MYNMYILAKMCKNNFHRGLFHGTLFHAADVQIAFLGTFTAPEIGLPLGFGAPAP